MVALRSLTKNLRRVREVQSENKKKSSRIVNESQGGGGLRDYYPGASFFLSEFDRNLHVSITALSVTEV